MGGNTLHVFGHLLIAGSGRAFAHPLIIHYTVQIMQENLLELQDIFLLQM